MRNSNPLADAMEETLARATGSRTGVNTTRGRTPGRAVPGTGIPYTETTTQVEHGIFTIGVSRIGGSDQIA